MRCRGAAQDALDLAVAAIDRLDVPRAPDPLAGRSGDALVWDVERRRNGWIAAVGVGDEQRIRCDDRLQPLLHAVCVEGGQGMAEGLARAVGGDQDRPRLAREPGLRAVPPRRRGLRSSFRSPLRLSRTKVSSTSTIPASRSGVWRTAARKRYRQCCAVRGAIPQRSAASLIVLRSASEAPKASQRSLWCRPDSAVPVSAPNVFPQALYRTRRRLRALSRDSAPPAPQCGRRCSSSTPKPIRRQRGRVL